MISLSTIPWNSVKTAGRYGLAAGGTIVAFAGAIGLLSQTDAATATQAIKDLVGALGTIATSLATLAGIGATAYATIQGMIKAAPTSQMKTLADQGVVVITDHATATAVPSPNVVSSLQEAAALPQVDKTPADARKSQMVRDSAGAA